MDIGVSEGGRGFGWGPRAFADPFQGPSGPSATVQLTRCDLTLARGLDLRFIFMIGEWNSVFEMPRGAARNWRAAIMAPGGQGADTVFECSGVPNAFAEGVRMARDRGLVFHVPAQGGGEGRGDDERPESREGRPGPVDVGTSP